MTASQESLDLEIKKLRFEYDISAYRTQIIQWKGKVLEANKALAAAQAQITDLEDRIELKELEMKSL